MIKRIILALLIVLIAPVGNAAQPAVHECDRVASHPYDPSSVAPGVLFGVIDTRTAIISCGVAYAERPDVIRFKYQYGRALLAASRPYEALIFLRSAAKDGYAAAQQSLATLLYDGDILSADKISAIRLFHKAAAQGHAIAQLRVASFYLSGVGTLPDLSKAKRFARRAADQGLPAAKKALEIIVRSARKNR